MDEQRELSTELLAQVSTGIFEMTFMDIGIEHSILEIEYSHS
jgi:hypothetical protein